MQRLAAGPGESRITADAVAMSMMGAYARRVLRAASMGVNETLELYSRCRVNQVRSVLHLHQVRGGVPRGEGTGAGATGRVCVGPRDVHMPVVLRGAMGRVDDLGSRAPVLCICEGGWCIRSALPVFEFHYVLCHLYALCVRMSIVH